LSKKDNDARKNNNAKKNVRWAFSIDTEEKGDKCKIVVGRTLREIYHQNREEKEKILHQTGGGKKKTN